MQISMRQYIVYIKNPMFIHKPLYTIIIDFWRMLYTGISFCIILIKSDNVITKRVIRQILQ